MKKSILLLILIALVVIVVMMSKTKNAKTLSDVKMKRSPMPEVNLPDSTFLQIGAPDQVEAFPIQ